MKHEYTIFTTCGLTFSEIGRSVADAVKRSPASGREFEVVAVVRRDCVVTPGSNPITAMIVCNRAALAPAPEGYSAPK